MIDGNGRIVGKGLLNNHRINVSDNGKMITTKKILKQ